MRHLLVLFYARLIGILRIPLFISDATMKLLFLPGLDGWRNFNAKARAYAEFNRTRRKVPAYRDFLDTRQFTFPSFKGLVPQVSEIPVADKQSYVNRYSIGERCIHGKIPDRNVMIDESSGSSGLPSNWVRGRKERKRNARFIRFGIRNLFGNKPLFIINAFALGPWATGINVTMSCVTFSRLKSLGPDRTKIENTVRQFGPGFHYIIMGYPPFLKSLVDEDGIDWKAHDISFIFGGESMSEGMRDYLVEKGIRKIYSSFGASDLELNISAENEFTISMRKLLRENATLRDRILQFKGAIPMLFQYNPSDFLIESSLEGELLITICRPGYLSPKIRYNIHDRGHVMPVKELLSIVKELGIKEDDYVKPKTDLPVLLHYGRSDMTVSFFGSNISPGDIQEALYSLPWLSAHIHSFSMGVNEDQDGDKNLVISMEYRKNGKSPVPGLQKAEPRFFDQLARVNQDFREARRMLGKKDLAKLKFYGFGKGPFAGNDIRIKARYLD